MRVCRSGCNFLEEVVRNMFFLIGGEIILIRVFIFWFFLVVMVNKLIDWVFKLMVVFVMVFDDENFLDVIRIIV